MIELKNNTGKELFLMVQIFGGLYTFLSFIMTILLYFVKDANKYGAKVYIKNSISKYILKYINIYEIKNNLTHNCIYIYIYIYFFFFKIV